VVVIDHHRVKEMAIKGILRLVDPGASSTVEIITQMLMSASEDIKIKATEADIMLAGMVTDSNSFRVRTNEKTYASAMKLKEYGANSGTT
jgi:c-di-AMP phosphodiesterase-like protein